MELGQKGELGRKGAGEVSQLHGLVFWDQWQGYVIGNGDPWGAFPVTLVNTSLAEAWLILFGTPVGHAVSSYAS